MIFIKINKKTIRLNPDRGERRVWARGPIETSFTCVGELPEELKDKCILTEWTDPPMMRPLSGVEVVARTNNQPRECKGLIPNPEDISFFLKKRDDIFISIESKNPATAIDCPPGPEYLYEYEKHRIRCKSCKILVQVDAIEIEEDWIRTGDGDEMKTETTLCPKCGETNCFPEFEYETINQALKRSK